MRYLHLFPQNNHFFKPGRLVWQEDEPKPSEAPKSEEEKTLDFLDQADASCTTAKKGGEAVEAVQQRICSLAEMEKTPEAVRLRQFIDELGEKYLNTLDGYENIKDAFERFLALQEITDFDAIMKRFNEAESYEIRPYVRGKNPAMIIFNYPPDEENPEGITEEFHLEMSFREKKDVIEKGAKALKESIEKKEKIAKKRRRKALSKQFKDYFESVIDLYSKGRSNIYPKK